MKFYICAALAFLSAFNSVYGKTDEERVETLASKIILENTSGYYILSDKSCWKVVGFSKRWRGVVEWWNRVELAPAKYNTIPSDWFIGSEIAVFSKRNALDVSEENASNYDVIRQCTHLLENQRTGHVLFAIYMPVEECFIQLAADSYKDGHAQGFAKCLQENFKSKTDSYSKEYDLGYIEGYKNGYDKGYQASERNSLPEAFFVEY